MTKRKSSRKPSSSGSRGSAAKSSRRSFYWKAALVLLVLFAGWVAYLDAVVTSRFEGRRWQVPSRVYARPLELYNGASLTSDGLAWELKQVGFAPVSSDPSQAGQFERSGDRFVIYTHAFRFPDGMEPSREVSLAIQGDRVAGMQVLKGAPSNIVRVQPLQIGGIYPSDNEDRILIQLKDLPPHLSDTLILVEDRDFYHHFGIAPLSMLRALFVDLRAGHVVQGGSTLTQQLAKNLFLTRQRTIGRKITEAMMAILLDFHYSKDEILETYLNEVYLGQDGKRAIHGFGLASQFYFGQPLHTLSLPQVAMLVGMVKGPTYYDPRRHPEHAMQRRNMILQLLADHGEIDAATARQAMAQPLGVIQRPSYSEDLYPAFVDLVKRHLSRDYKEQDLRSAGLRIFTTLNPQVQHAAEQAESTTLARLDPHPGKSPLEGALVVTGKESGEVLALVGGRNPRYAGFNRALDASRQIGSLVKPALYLTALSHPDRYTLITPLKDEPFNIVFDDGKSWSPRNYDHKAHGEVPLHEALAHSYNLATVRVGLDVGVDNVIDTMHKLGVKEALPNYPAMLLGAGTLTPVDVTAMYQSIAAGGFDVPLRSIRDVMTADGKVLSRYNLKVKQVVDPRADHLVQYAMQEVMREGTGQSAYRYLPSDLSAAGKTGTTDDSRDSWFAGFTGDYLAVAWVGRDDNAPTRFTGATGALRVWSDLMASLPQHSLEPVVPAGVTYYWVDGKAQALTEEGCPGARYVPFIDGSEPKRTVSCAGAIGHRIRSWFEDLMR